MALLMSLVSLLFSIFYTPLLMFLLGMVFLASINRSLGVRKLYTQILLKLFEYGKQHIEIAKKIRDGDSDTEDDAGGGDGVRNPLANQTAGMRKNHSMVITREDHLILQPDPDSTHTGNNNLQLPNNFSQESLQYSAVPADSRPASDQHEFELADCLNLIRTGVEAIIEDEVTSRFEAEELRSWNLLTRTNMNYEFISWRLTVIWMCGFLMRYFFLLPLRVFVLIFGMVVLLVSTALIGLLPESCMKRQLASLAFKVAFRILMRSLSVTISLHNMELQPRTVGICVANHTSVIDVGVLATQTAFSLTMWLTLCTALVGLLADGPIKHWVHYHVFIMCFGVLSNVVSCVAEYHNPQNKPKSGICVANHTTPIDVLVLACDHAYSLIGQRHGGFLGILQRALARASPHIWFERSEVKDRHAVARRIREHVSNPNNPPVMIFPEGTCINNTSVMQFKKGSFEVGSVVYPVAIKYDARFGDAFWNSSKYSMLQYLYCLMTSWAIVCDVWYLPPMVQADDETPIDFANRVKGAIAQQGGLVDLAWDGQLKRTHVKPEWKLKQQEEFSKRIKHD